MPAPLDIAIWQSIWTLVSPSRENSQFDFKVGFYGTAVLGICFLLLGMNSFYGSGVSLASSAGGFASQLIDVFTRSLGDWSYWVVAIAAFTTMFSTMLTCFDAMPRVMNHILRQWSAKSIDTTQIWRFILGVGTAVILFYFIANMREMVNFATIISFLTAPILAVLCFLLVRKSKSIRNLWSSTESILAIAGILLLIAFSFIYLLHIT
jgi:Mn2+/Fe2+ NRAMP family transporter